MKVQINKDILVSALEKMHTVSTKALIPNFNFTGKVTVEVKKSGRIVLTSSNGCLTVQQEVEAHKGFDNGICTTNSVKLLNSVKKIVTESPSDPIEFNVEHDILIIRDTNSKRRKIVKLPIEIEHHNTKIMQKPDGDSFFIEADHFLKGFRAVFPFLSKGSYPPQYQTIYMHWIGKETRMICGDGAIFSIMSFPRHSKDSHKREFKRTILASQLSVIANLFEDSTDTIEMKWKDKTTLWVQSGEVEILARGLPEIDYVNYESNAYRFSEAKAYADIKCSDIKEVTALLSTLDDQQRADVGKAHSCVLTIPSSPGNACFEIKKNQGKFQCEYEIPAVYHDLGDQSSFECCYANLFFASPSQVMRHDTLRLYLISETGVGVVNAKDVELGEPDRDGIPVALEESDGCSLHFFFARLRDNEENDGEDEE